MTNEDKNVLIQTREILVKNEMVEALRLFDDILAGLGVTL